MIQILLNSAKISTNLKRNFLIPLLFSMFANFAIAQSGIYESYAILSIKGGSNSYYDMQAATANPDFNGANLGSFVYGLETLVFKGGQNKTYKNSGCNINSSLINYRIYLSGSPLGSYNNVNESFLSDDGGGNQTWEGLTGSANLIAGLSPGTYTIEVYSQAGYDSCGAGTHFSSNGGSNYKATFTVVKAESTTSVTGSDIFTYNTLAQGPNTSVVTGSTGTVTYSYTGVSPTYGPSATKPTLAGSYTVTATVAADDNYNGASSLATPFTIGASTNIPDENFEQALIDLGLDSGSLDHYVLTSNISNVTDLDVSSLGITDLTGIQGFSNLYGLICEDNLLTSLDVSALPNLRNLSMLGNQLVNASDLMAHPNLTYLDCDDNLFTSLDLSTLINLTDLYCSGNQLTSLDVRGLANLQYFECTNNPFLSCILVDDVAAANTATTTIAEQNDPSQPYYYAKDATTANYSYCDCDSTTTWTSASGGSWSNGMPTTGTYAAIIAFDYSEAANINACSLTVNANANVTIPSGYNVTLNAPLIVESGSSFTLSNNSNLVQTNKKSINSGTITVNRNSNALHRLDFSLWSSPVTGAQTLAAFSPLTSQSPNRFYTFDPNGNQYVTASFGSPFTQGAGYLIRMPNTDPTTNYNSGTAPLIFSGVFTGKANNGDISVTTVSNKFNGIGNPYPSVIDAVLFKALNTGINTLYFWRKTNNPLQGTSPTTSYAVYNIATATGTGVAPDGAAAGEPTITPDKYIQVGQGFVVETSQSSVVFNNAMRVANNGNKFLKTKQIEKSRIWLNLSNPSWPINQMALCYMDGASVSLDETDSKYINDSPIALTSNINDEEYSIQGRPTFDATDVVALNFKTNLAGDYTIAIDHVDGLFSGSQDVYLIDSKTGTETNLKTSSYPFTAAAGVDNARFSLKYQKTLKVDAPAFDDNSISVYNNNGTIHVNSKSAAISNIKVFDVQGRLLAEQKNIKSTTATINNLRADNQVLIVKIASENRKEVTKKLLN